jgi:hypothetical protein
VCAVFMIYIYIYIYGPCHLGYGPCSLGYGPHSLGICIHISWCVCVCCFYDIYIYF